jgi:hypothetical protein
MSLAGSCFSSESAPGPLYGVFFVKEFASFPSSVFLVRSQSPFLRPDLRIADGDVRRICVTPTLRHASHLPGHTLTASARRHANAVAMTIRGEPAFGVQSICSHCDVQAASSGVVSSLSNNGNPFRIFFKLLAGGEPPLDHSHDGINVVECSRMRIPFQMGNVKHHDLLMR